MSFCVFYWSVSVMWMQYQVPSSTSRLLVLSDKRTAKEFQAACHLVPY